MPPVIQPLSDQTRNIFTYPCIPSKPFPAHLFLALPRILPKPQFPMTSVPAHHPAHPANHHPTDPKGPVARPYKCPYDSCGKAFSRLEHRVRRLSSPRKPLPFSAQSPAPLPSPHMHTRRALSAAGGRVWLWRLALLLSSLSVLRCATSCSRQRPERSQPGPTRVASPTAQKACPSPHARRSFQFERSRTPQQPITLINLIPFHRPDISAPIQARSPINANTQAAKNASVVQTNSLAT